VIFVKFALLGRRRENFEITLDIKEGGRIKRGKPVKMY
jgi:hypothetical protein